jgi:hypothetical protein
MQIAYGGIAVTCQQVTRFPHVLACLTLVTSCNPKLSHKASVQRLHWGSVVFMNTVARWSRGHGRYLFIYSMLCGILTAASEFIAPVLWRSGTGAQDSNRDQNINVAAGLGRGAGSIGAAVGGQMHPDTRRSTGCLWVPLGKIIQRGTSSKCVRRHSLIFKMYETEQQKVEQWQELQAGYS